MGIGDVHPEFLHSSLCSFLVSYKFGSLTKFFLAEFSPIFIPAIR